MMILSREGCSGEGGGGWGGEGGGEKGVGWDLEDGVQLLSHIMNLCGIGWRGTLKRKHKNKVVLNLPTAHHKFSSVWYFDRLPSLVDLNLFVIKIQNGPFAAIITKIVNNPVYNRRTLSDC